MPKKQYNIKEAYILRKTAQGMLSGDIITHTRHCPAPNSHKIFTSIYTKDPTDNQVNCIITITREYSRTVPPKNKYCPECGTKLTYFDVEGYCPTCNEAR